MASPKIPWQRLWQRLWQMIADPNTDGRLLLALDDYINPKTGKKIFGCANVFDHAAKTESVQIPLGAKYRCRGTGESHQGALGLSTA